jgi:hypothetical protein
VTPYGDTLLHLYRTGTEQEIEEALSSWLRATIAKLEAEIERNAANFSSIAPAGADASETQAH